LGAVLLPIFEMSELFSQRLQEEFASKSYKTNILSRNKYEEILNNLKSQKNTRTSRRYFLENVGIEEEEIRLKRRGSNKIVLPIDDFYKVIEKIHIELGHARRNITGKRIHKIYANIGYGVVQLFIDCCKQCQQKASKQKKGIVVRPILEDAFNSRCQLDLIDMQTRPDGDYKFIFNYQDHFTKYLRLHPLKTKLAEEVAENLLDILMDLGCPIILHTDNGKKFSNKVIKQKFRLGTLYFQRQPSPSSSSSSSSEEVTL